MQDIIHSQASRAQYHHSNTWLTGLVVQWVGFSRRGMSGSQVLTMQWAKLQHRPPPPQLYVPLCKTSGDTPPHTCTWLSRCVWERETGRERGRARKKDTDVWQQRPYIYYILVFDDRGEGETVVTLIPCCPIIAWHVARYESPCVLQERL